MSIVIDSCNYMPFIYLVYSIYFCICIVVSRKKLTYINLFISTNMHILIQGHNMKQFISNLVAPCTFVEAFKVCQWCFTCLITQNIALGSIFAIHFVFYLNPLPTDKEENGGQSSWRQPVTLSKSENDLTTLENAVTLHGKN